MRCKYSKNIGCCRKFFSSLICLQLYEGIAKVPIIAYAQLWVAISRKINSNTPVQILSGEVRV